nr:MAG TPA: dehydrogenase accessory protein [Caudoviricetes sp.]
MRTSGAYAKNLSAKGLGVIMAKSAKCLFCGNPATLLCDGIIGWDADEDENHHLSNARGIFMCDAPMCAECGTWHGNIFFSGRSGGMETRDYCPLCEDLHVKGEVIREDHNRKGKAIREPALQKEQAAIIRQAHWNSYLNAHRRELNAIQGGGQQCLPF